MTKEYYDRFEETIHFREAEDEQVLRFMPRSKGSILVYIEKTAEKIKLVLDARKNTDVSVFILNGSDQSADVRLELIAAHDARLEAGLLDLNKHSLNLDVKGFLQCDGADIDFYTGILSVKDADKNSDIKIQHDAPHTRGRIHNFAVCFEEGKYKMVADGTIGKGRYGSESHQETRVLTMADRHKVEVIPILYIDENDVKASHALSIGQPDETQMYYLQSRGLSKEQAIGLISVGYFKPVIDLVRDEELHKRLSEEMEKQVGLYEHH